jgi:hypothetical protein
MFRALAKRVKGRWRFVSFRGSGGGEWRGVVDILAVRKSSAARGGARLKAGDLFDLVLVQLKGGDSPMPTRADVLRLRRVARHYRALRVVLHAWKRGTHSEYYILDEKGRWIESSAYDAFA